MAFTEALYYPWIDITDEAWLKTSLLYWDSVRTIVPVSIDAPYSSETAQVLQGAGFLVPLRVHSNMEEIEELTTDVLRYFNTFEGFEVLVGQNAGPRHLIHVDSVSSHLARLERIHPDKLPNEIRRMVRSIGSASRGGHEWLEVDEGFALFYLTLLAKQLAERIGAGLLTPMPAAERLAVAARLDSQIGPIVGRYREYEAFGPRWRVPNLLAPGMLSQLAVQQIAIAPDTPIDDILDFKRRHADELGRFRSEIGRLVAAVEEDQPLEALRQRVSDLYTNEVRPAIVDLQKSLEGRSIRWFAEGLFKVAYLAVPPAMGVVGAGVATGMDASMIVPIALLSGIGLSLIVSRVMYNVDRLDALRKEPYTYLLSAAQELGPGRQRGWRELIP